MIEIVELKLGELPPEPNFRMVQCAPPDERQTIKSSKGTTIIVPEHQFESAVDEQRDLAEKEGLSKLYVVRSA